MTLLELLVKELPGKGGWRTRADFVSVSYGMAKFYSNRHGYLEDIEWAGVSCVDFDYRDGEKITHGQYETALAASKQPAWSGEGLPPVNGECMALFDTNDDEWLRVKIIAHDEGIIIGRWLDGVKEGLLFEYRYKASDYRPLRTEAERRKHDAVVALAVAEGSDGNLIGMKLDDGQIVGSDWFNVYDAIAAGKIPGVKLEDS